MNRIPRYFIAVTLFVLPIATTVGASIQLPFSPEESRVIQSMLERNGAPISEVADPPRWQTNTLRQQLESLGVEPDSFQLYTISLSDKERIGLTFAYDQEGHILGIRGNGPWFDNDSLRSLTALPRLRALWMSHNGHAGKQESNPYNGSGFDALADSNIQSIRTGLGLDDAGMEQVAKIASLREFHVGHSKVSEAGVRFFEGHPNLESFSVSELRVTENALANIGRIPNLKEVGFNESYITYDNGFIHLKPLAGQLEKINLRMSLFRDEDLQRLRADHPEAEIVTQTPQEIVQTHPWIANQLTRLAPPEVAAPLEAALADRKAAK